MPKFWDYIHDDSGGRVLRLEGPIDSDSFWGDEITPQDFRDELYAEDGDLTLWINSPGGNVFAAAEIYTMIRDYPHNVTVRIASIAASAASVIAMAGNTVQMSPTALLMIHDPCFNYTVTHAFRLGRQLRRVLLYPSEHLIYHIGIISVIGIKRPCRCPMPTT